MERKDYSDGYKEGTVEPKRRIVLTGNPEEVDVLMRGLDALAALATQADAVSGTTVNSHSIAQFERLHEDIATVNIQGL